MAFSGRVLKTIALGITLLGLMLLIEGTRPVYVLPIILISLIIGIVGYAKSFPG